MRMEGTVLRDFSDMADNKGRFKEYARHSLSMFKSTFYDAFKRSANWTVNHCSFEECLQLTRLWCGQEVMRTLGVFCRLEKTICLAQPKSKSDLSFAFQSTGFNTA